MRLDHEWFVRTNAFRQIGGALPSKTNVIHCIFSGSDVGSKWGLLCSLLHPNKTPQSHWSNSYLHRFRTVDSSLRAGLKLDATVNQPSWEGLGLCDVTQTSIWERLDFRKGFKHKVDVYYYRVVVYKYCQHTFQFKQHVKVNLVSDDNSGREVQNKSRFLKQNNKLQTQMQI